MADLKDTVIDGVLTLKLSDDIVSGATTSLSSATGNIINILGTATITSFGTANAGVIYWLVLNGCTLTHNAVSLILPGAANIVSAAGDIAGFTSLGSGNWRCFAYQLASGVGGGGGGGSTYKVDNVSATSRILGRMSTGSGVIEELTLSQVLDLIGSAVPGDLLVRGSTSWQRLPKGTGNQLLGMNAGGTAHEYKAYPTVTLPDVVGGNYCHEQYVHRSAVTLYGGATTLAAVKLTRGGTLTIARCVSPESGLVTSVRINRNGVAVNSNTAIGTVVEGIAGWTAGDILTLTCTSDIFSSPVVDIKLAICGNTCGPDYNYLL